MPTAQGILSGKKITVMRDTGCTSAVVRCKLVKETEMTGKHQSCVEMPVYDIIIGIIKGALPPQDPDASRSPPQMH